MRAAPSDAVKSRTSPLNAAAIIRAPHAVATNRLSGSRTLMWHLRLYPRGHRSNIPPMRGRNTVQDEQHGATTDEVRHSRICERPERRCGIPLRESLAQNDLKQHYAYHYHKQQAGWDARRDCSGRKGIVL